MRLIYMPGGSMALATDLYDSHYSHAEEDIYREVRRETFGEDLGQASWITANECDEFCRWLGLRAEARVLEIACGTGGVSARIAAHVGASVVGVDISQAAVAAATARARAHGIQDRARFQVADANEALPFPGASFDAVFCNDAINHLTDRERSLRDWHRVLRPGGMCLHTDPIVVTGCLSNAEIAARSSIGFFLFTPVGANESFLRAAGFRVVRKADVTEAVVTSSKRWREARAQRKEALVRMEGAERYEALQGFLAIVHTLASQRRLSRFAFLAQAEHA